MLFIFIFLLSLITFSVARPAIGKPNIFPILSTTTTTTFQTTVATATAAAALRTTSTTSISLTAAAATRKTKTRTSTSTSTSTTSTATSGYASTTTFLFQGTTLPTGLSASNWLVDTVPLAHQFVPANAYVSGGFLNLLVPGGQSSTNTTQAAEVSTDFTIASASVETYAILTEVPGVCNGMFYYQSRNQETDIEWLSSARSNANIQTPYKRAMFYTNQPTDVGGNVTQVTGPPPLNPTTTVHNYQLIWNNNVSTNFYIDGKFQRTITTNVASGTSGRWFWNNWTSGDPYWTVGPPKTDAVFKIQKIVMRYNPGS